MLSLENQIEALLFWKAEPISIGELAKILGKSEVEIGEALNNLEPLLTSRGIRLMRKDNEVVLGTAPEVSELISKLTREEFSRDVGKAGLETLAVIIYQGPVSRSQIDYIRGVNSSFVLRHLLVRDLVERVPNSEDARSFLYRPTFKLLSHLGISKLEDIPNLVTIKQKLDEFTSTPTSV